MITIGSHLSSLFIRRVLFASPGGVQRCPISEPVLECDPQRPELSNVSELISPTQGGGMVNRKKRCRVVHSCLQLNIKYDTSKSKENEEIVFRILSQSFCTKKEEPGNH